MRIPAALLCATLAACSQTTTRPTTGHGPDTKVAARTAAKTAPRAASAQDRCQEAVTKAQQQAMNGAMLGSALSVVGGFGGFGGRGGAIAAQALSAGGSMMQAKARNDAQSEVQSECLS